MQQPDNQEADIHPMYGYLYATDLHEGLIMTAAGTLLDGNPLNNFLKKDVVFNPNGLLNGASSITIIGTHAWICCRAGIVIVSLEDPQRPRAVRVLGPDQLQNPRAVEAQFRYAFVLDQRGLQVLDITQPENPQPAASMPLADARSLYVARATLLWRPGKTVWSSWMSRLRRSRESIRSIRLAERSMMRGMSNWASLTPVSSRMWPTGIMGCG